MDEISFREAQPYMEDLNKARNALAQLKVMREQYTNAKEVMTLPHRFDYKLERDYADHHSPMSHPGFHIILDIAVFLAMRDALRREERRLIAVLNKLGVEGVDTAPVIG